MILGLSVSAFTTLHVIISLLGIAAGFVVVGGMLAGRPLDRWNTVFLATTIATSVTGFFFPFVRIGPPHVVGVISLVVLAAALVALYRYRLAGPWRWIYAVSAVAALYLNVFLGVVQAFLKIAALNALAPTGAERPFALAQSGVLVLFTLLGYLAFKRFRPAA